MELLRDFAKGEVCVEVLVAEGVVADDLSRAVEVCMTGLDIDNAANVDNKNTDAIITFLLNHFSSIRSLHPDVVREVSGSCLIAARGDGVARRVVGEMILSSHFDEQHDNLDVVDNFATVTVDVDDEEKVAVHNHLSRSHLDTQSESETQSQFLVFAAASKIMKTAR